MTEHYELQDDDGRNVGECYDATIHQAIARARWTQQQLQPSGKVGRLRVVRVHERMVPERTETELATFDRGFIVATHRNRADGIELRALGAIPLELDAA